MLEKEKYIRKSIKSNYKKYSYTHLGFTVPHNVIESIKTMDKSKLYTTIYFKLVTFLEQVTCVINEREDNSITTEILKEQSIYFIRGKNVIKHINLKMSILARLKKLLNS